MNSFDEILLSQDQEKVYEEILRRLADVKGDKERNDAVVRVADRVIAWRSGMMLLFSDEELM